MKQPLKIDNDLGFFEIEKTEGNFEYSHDGIEYSNLFDFYYFLDAIEECNDAKNQSLSLPTLLVAGQWQLSSMDLMPGKVLAVEIFQH